MMSSPQTLLWAGLAIGLAFGVVGQWSGFCLTSGLRNWLTTGDGGKIRSFALALATALVLSQALDALGWVQLSRSLYMQPSLSLLVPVGGLLFGYGMVTANACGSRSVILLASGNLRSLLVLLCLGISAAATLTGLLAPLREWASPVAIDLGTAPPTLTSLLAGWGLSPSLSRWLVVGALAAPLIAFAVSSERFRASPRLIVSGPVVGFLVAAGWYATGVLGADDFDPAPLASLTFVAPVSKTIQYAMLATGMRLDFGVVVVCGVFLGALASALATRTVMLEGFTRPRAVLRYAGGGTLMGIGGALALGCSIGQGLTGLSTLALASFPAAGGILLGAALALRGPLKLGPPHA